MAKNTRSPYNNENELFKRLTRLFSGPIVNLHSQTYRDLKRKQLDNYKFKSVSGQSFKRANFNPFESIHLAQLTNQNRTSRYIDYDQMEFEPILAGALNLYADEITFHTELQDILRVDCANAEIKHVLRALFYDVLNIENNAFGWVRSFIKYGDLFLYLDIDEVLGIRGVQGLPSHEVERLEGEDKTNPNYIQYQWNSGALTFEDWQIAHFRNLANDKMAPYGTSVLEPARRIWRQLDLLEQYMLSYRLVRSSERNIIYVDVGGINPDDVEQHVLAIQAQMKKNQVLDSETGRVDLRYSPYYTVESDFYLPVRGDSKTRIDRLSGATYNGGIDDVKYLKDKLFAAIQVPQAYLFRGEGADEDKTTLAQKDIRFARTIQRLQKEFLSELYKIAIVHLYVLGFRDSKDITGFKLSLNNPSRIAELQELEYWKTKLDVGASANDSIFSRRWVAANLFHLSEEEFERNQREKWYDAQYDAALTQIAEGAEGEGGLGGGGDMFGDFDSDEGLGDEGGMDDLVDDTVSSAGSEGEEGALLAAPARRSDETTTPRSKGKMYKPVKSDSRTIGARARHFNSQWGSSLASGTERNVFKGYSPLKGLARGVAESMETTYQVEEESMLDASRETRRLLENLERRYGGKEQNEDKAAQ